MIEFNGLEKRYGSFQAVSPLSFSIAGGQVFGFLGPNGAGKTTTIRMLMGILTPTGGRASIDGLDCQRDQVEVKRRIGYLPDNPIFYDFLRGTELLIFVARMHGLTPVEAARRAGELLDQFTLTDAAQEFAVNYSMGMKKKLGLAMAMIHRPKLLILDEPINGLDPRAAHDIQNRLAEFAKGGGTVLLSTHVLDMAEKICTQVGIIDQGKILAIDSVENLRHKFVPGGSLEDIFMKITDKPS
jgi:ABC-2 type transport system ATP-binding protein